MDLPNHARVVIVGGGIAGCALAYHLAALGERDVLLVEQGRLTCGTTWHAAGLVGQLQPGRTAMAMARDGSALYAALEAETGVATGWRRCGGLELARTPERWQALRRQAARARALGIEAAELTAREAGELHALMRSDDLAGALWLPGDGTVDPAALTLAFAAGARARGVAIVEGVEASGVKLERGRVRAVPTTQGMVRCELVIVCAGQWARQFGRALGVAVALHPAEHFYLATGPIEGVASTLPVLRDPDGFIDCREEAGGFVIGGFAPVARPWTVDPVPADFQFQLLPAERERFDVLLRHAVHRLPCLAHAIVKTLRNGPESFTPDGQPILGPAPGVSSLYFCAGFNAAGIGNGGGAGRLMAEWVLGGEPPGDVGDVDLRRFAPFMGNRKVLAERTAETLARHSAIHWPDAEPASARAVRTSPLHDRLHARGAEFGSRFGWECANYFRRPPAAPRPAPTFGRPGWLDWVIEEQRATREAVALYDRSALAKLLVQGRDALALLQRLCANDVDVAPGEMLCTPLLNERGGIESALTMLRLAEDRFWLVGAATQATRDADWIERHVAAGEFALLTDVSALHGVLALMGPNAATLLARTSADELPRRHGETREIDLGHARVRAARLSYVDGPGWELHVPAEMLRHVERVLWEAGADLGLADAGDYALDALRIEAGRRAWGAELGPEVTPREAGLMGWVRMDKADKVADFIGREALAEPPQPPARRLVAVVADDAADHLWGGEAIVLEGQAAGALTSAGFSRAAGRCIAFGWLLGDAAAQAHEGTPVEVDLGGRRAAARAWDRWQGG